MSEVIWNDWELGRGGGRREERCLGGAASYVATDTLLLLDRFIPQDLANTVWAYATAQISHPKMFRKVAKAAIQRKREFISQQIANLLWAYATKIGIVDKHLYSSFVPTAAKLVGAYNNQDIANCCVEKKGSFENAALFQLHQWHLWQTKENSNPGLPIELLDRKYNAFTCEEPRVPSSRVMLWRNYHLSVLIRRRNSHG
eukprot:scaffold4323_cov133-Skeletonema_marinoi.AAC.5